MNIYKIWRMLQCEHQVKTFTGKRDHKNLSLPNPDAGMGAVLIDKCTHKWLLSYFKCPPLLRCRQRRWTSLFKLIPNQLCVYDLLLHVQTRFHCSCVCNNRYLLVHLIGCKRSCCNNVNTNEILNKISDCRLMSRCCFSSFLSDTDKCDVAEDNEAIT